MGGFVDYLRMVMGWWSAGEPAAEPTGGGWAESASIFIPGADDIATFQPGAIQASVFVPGAEAMEVT